MNIAPFNKPRWLMGHAVQGPVPVICAMIVALAMTGCVPPKAPPVSAAAEKPQASLPELEAIQAAQTAIKTRQDTQESTLLSMQEHIALLDSRLDMIEYSLGIGKGSPHALKQQHGALLKEKPKPKLRPKPKPAADNMPPKGAEKVAAVPKPAAAPAPEKAAGKVAAAPVAEAPKVPALSKAEQAKMQKAFGDAMALLKSGDYEKATSTLSAFIKKYPAQKQASAARYWLGEAWFAQMQVPQAIEALKPFEDMPADSPKRAPALFRLGASYQRQGGKLAAAHAFEILRRDYPKSIEADNAAKQLKLLGIAVLPVATPQSSAAQPPVPSRWAVNIVSLDNQSDAQHALARLHAQGIRAETMRVTVDGKLWYRLRVTGYASRNAADEARQSFIRQGYSSAWTGPQ